MPLWQLGVDIHSYVFAKNHTFSYKCIVWDQLNDIKMHNISIELVFCTCQYFNINSIFSLHSKCDKCASKGHFGVQRTIMAAILNTNQRAQNCALRNKGFRRVKLIDFSFPWFYVCDDSNSARWHRSVFKGTPFYTLHPWSLEGMSPSEYK